MDERDLEQLVAQAAAADEAAWQALWAAIEQPLDRMVAQPRFLGRLGRHEDDRRNIVVAVMARLRADHFHRLQLYLEAKRTNPGLGFYSWLRVVAKRVGVDYLRAHPDYLRGEARWVVPETLQPSRVLAERPPLTDRGVARELLSYAGHAIPRDQQRALALWIRGDSFEDIARALGLADAEKTVRAAIERLRRRFRKAS